MSSPYYKLYVEGVFALARSLVIKSEATADAINRGLEELGIAVNKSNPETWKYYLNLSGQYHHTDTMITVSSMDTLETIEFTKENLEVHRATANGYAEGSGYFKDLVRRHPDHEMLIRGILNPVDIQTAIEAGDGKILHYDSSLVESNETNLMTKLQDWIMGFLTRWNIEAYAIVDDLYVSSMLGVLFSNLPPVIMNIRLENCKTNYVHSFHIREYLASNGRLDVFMDYLTKKQALFLYRNIRYIHRNAGKRKTFELLVEKIFTDRGMPLASYDMRHNLSHMPEELYPEIEMILTFLNFEVGEDYRDTRTVGEILDKEITIADGNFEENEFAYSYVPEKMKTANVDKVPTKVLESIVTDTSDAGTLSDILLNHWLYLSTHDRYNAVLSITDPSSGQQLNLTAKEAFVVYLYSFNRACDVTLPYVPDLIAVFVKRPTLPTFSELRKVADPEYVSDEVIQKSLLDHPPMGVYISVESFLEYCKELHALYNEHKTYYTLEEHFITRGQTEGMLMDHWHFPTCELGEGESFTQWFSDRGLNIEDLTQLDHGVLAADILEVATGANLNDTQSLREIQAAMVRLMTQLSSYTVQYLRTINSSTFRKADWASIRVGDTYAHGNVDIDVSNSQTDVLELHAKGYDGINSRLGNYSIFKSVTLPREEYVWIDIDLDYKVKEITKAKFRAPMAAVGVLDFTATEIDP